jgi:K+-sensing histidine kinase KdpD
MYKKVMVAIGNDESSPFALQEALHIASRDGAKLCVVHAAAKADDEESKKNEQAGVALLEQARLSAGAQAQAEIRLLNDVGEYGLNSIAEVIAFAGSEWGVYLIVFC